MAQRTDTAHVGDRGRVVLPAEVRRRAGLRTGDRLLVLVEPDGSILLRKREDAIGRGRGLFADVAPGRALGDELIAERRAEAALEEALISGDRRRIASARRALALAQATPEPERAGP